MSLSTQIKVLGGLPSAGGVASGGSATTDAGDLTTGTLAAARLPGVLANVDTQAELLSAAAAASKNAACCVLQKSAYQTVSAATWTDITFDEEVLDTNSWHSNSTNNARVTVDTAGKYLVITPWMLRPASNNPVLFAIAKNGTRLANLEHYHNIQSSGVINGGQFSYIVDLAANDYITQQIYCAAETYVYGSDARGDESSHRLIVIRIGD